MRRTIFGFTMIWLDQDYSVGEVARIGWNLYEVVIKIGHWYLLKEFISKYSLTAC